MEQDYSSHNILVIRYITQEWDLPEKKFLLASDGHWWITLDYRKGNDPTVRWIDIDSDENIHLANSFGKFFEALVSENYFAKEYDD